MSIGATGRVPSMAASPARTRNDATTSTASGGVERPRRPRWLRIAVSLLLLCVAFLAVGSPWWGPLALSRLDYFHVRRLEFEGLRYAKAAELVELARVDTTQSVWQALPPIARRLSTHALIAEAEVERRLPGTLLLRVVEREPVALVAASGVLRPTDAGGHALPIDPAKVALDVPVAASADSAVLHLLDGLRQHAPGLYARVTEARRIGADELQFTLGPLRVRTGSDVTVARFRDILRVEADLARNHLRVVELDLRFRDQVIARQP